MAVAQHCGVVGATNNPQKITARSLCNTLATRKFLALCDSLEKMMERCGRKMQLPMVFVVTDVGSNLFSIVRRVCKTFHRLFFLL